MIENYHHQGQSTPVARITSEGSRIDLSPSAYLLFLRFMRARGGAPIGSLRKDGRWAGAQRRPFARLETGLKEQPQERSLIAGAGQPCFWSPKARLLPLD